MSRILLSVPLILGLSSACVAGEIRTPDTGVSPRNIPQARGECVLSYHNFCSGWTYSWTGYNGTEWVDLEGSALPPARVGVCYDLTDCAEGCEECQNLTGVWFAFARFSEYGTVDLEIYCADQNCCPAGAALGGFYDYPVDIAGAWQYFQFDGLRVNCADCRFIVMVTVNTPEHCAPYSDANDLNRIDGCEPDWRCSSHSYCYRSLVDYCDVYGHPGALITDYPGACPPDDGFYAEWLCYAYLSCGGLTGTHENSWSQIKAFYR